MAAAASKRLQLTRTNVLAERATVTEQQAPNTSVPAGGDPWEDEKWSKLKWTVYRRAGTIFITQRFAQCTEEGGAHRILIT